MIMTFEQYVSQEQMQISGATGEFTLLLSGLTLATRMIQAQVRRAGPDGHSRFSRRDQRAGRGATEA